MSSLLQVGEREIICLGNQLTFCLFSCQTLYQPEQQCLFFSGNVGEQPNLTGPIQIGMVAKWKECHGFKKKKKLLKLRAESNIIHLQIICMCHSNVTLGCYMLGCVGSVVLFSSCAGRRCTNCRRWLFVIFHSYLFLFCLSVDVWKMALDVVEKKFRFSFSSLFMSCLEFPPRAATSWWWKCSLMSPEAALSGAIGPCLGPPRKTGSRWSVRQHAVHQEPYE